MLVCLDLHRSAYAMACCLLSPGWFMFTFSMKLDWRQASSSGLQSELLKYLGYESKKCFHSSTLENVQSTSSNIYTADLTETCREASGQHGESELLKSFYSDIQNDQHRITFRTIRQIKVKLLPSYRWKALEFLLSFCADIYDGSHLEFLQHLLLSHIIVGLN